MRRHATAAARACACVWEGGRLAVEATPALSAARALCELELSDAPQLTTVTVTSTTRVQLQRQREVPLPRDDNTVNTSPVLDALQPLLPPSPLLPRGRERRSAAAHLPHGHPAVRLPSSAATAVAARLHGCSASRSAPLLPLEPHGRHVEGTSARQRGLDAAPTLQAPSRSRAFPPLLDALRPILPLLNPLLTDADVSLLLRTSRTTALALLPGYTFTSHVFTPTSLGSLRRLRDLCLTYDLRVTQLSLPDAVKELPLDSTSPHMSPIPASVTALSLRPPRDGASCYQQQQRWAAFSAPAPGWQHREERRLLDLFLSLERYKQERSALQIDLTQLPAQVHLHQERRLW